MKMHPATIRAAADVGSLAAMFGTGEEAALEAIRGAVTSAEQEYGKQTIRRIRDIAENCENEEVKMHFEFLAEQMEYELGIGASDEGYNPKDGDLIQLTVVGILSEYRIKQTGSEFEDTLWQLETTSGLQLPLDVEDLVELNVVRLFGDGGDEE